MLTETGLSNINRDLQAYSRLEGINEYGLNEDIETVKDYERPAKRLERFQAEVRRVGIPATVDNVGLLGADYLIAGDYQVPAYMFYESGGSLRETKTLARRRITSAIAKGASIAGAVIASWGLSEKSPTKAIGGLGMAIQATAAIVDNPNRNRAGNHWHIHITDIITANEHLLGMMKTDLVQAGFTAQEINSIEDLGIYTYNTELVSSRIDRAANLLMPLGIGGAMISYENYILGLTTIGLGLASFPIGEIAYINSNVKRRGAGRAARSIRNAVDWRRKLGNDHINMITFLNSLAQTNRIVQAVSTILNPTNPNLFSNIYGLEFGLNGLNGALSQQRSREDARRNTEMSKRLIRLLGSEHLILTPNKWKSHVEKHGITHLEDPEIENGIMIKNFKTKLPDGTETNLPPVNLTAEQGRVIILKGKSGDGKSTFFSGPLHIAEHTGDLFIVENGKATDVHEFENARDIDKHIRMISVNMFSPTSRIVDAFRVPFSKIFKADDIEFHPQDELLVRHATLVADNLLEVEINNIKERKHSFYPKRLLAYLEKIREQRNKWVNGLLNSAGGNLNVRGITATSVFGDGSLNGGLSNGQRQRVAMLLAETLVCTEPDLKTIIFDEPLDKLDEGENLQLQLQAIERIRNHSNAPAIIIISHQHINELADKTDAKVIDLNKPLEKAEDLIKSNGHLVH